MGIPDPNHAPVSSLTMHMLETVGGESYFCLMQMPLSTAIQPRTGDLATSVPGHTEMVSSLTMLASRK